MKCTNDAPDVGRLLAIVIAVGVALSLAGCAGTREAAYDTAMPGSYAEPADAELSGSVAVPEGAPAAGRAALGDLAAESPTVSEVGGESNQTVSGGDSPSERLRVYSASVELVVPSVEAAKDRIISIVETSGGYVESSSAGHLVVRVPAARFDELLAAIEDTGDVRSHSVSTSDVTDQFFDLQRRLRISEASRDRLLGLLEETNDADQRVSLLREIRRLTEEIEQLRASLESLSELIRYSRITVQLVPRIQETEVARQRIPFAWIAALGPLDRTTGPARQDIDIASDPSFAVFESGQTLFAEAADGTQVRAGAVTNVPRGDERFWQSALAYHLSGFYRSVTRVASGAYRGVLLESKDADPFFYLVLVHSRSEELVVVEVFFPDADAKEARMGTILSLVEGGAQ